MTDPHVMIQILPDLPRKTFFRVDEVARFFDVSTRTIYLWIDNGLLLAINPTGGTKRIFRESIVSLIEKSLKAI
jgi:excisionase family DNA binding protein